MMVLATSKTTSTGMLPVLADTTVTGGNVPSVLACFGEMSRHLDVRGF
jgi:hypothetical protein